MAYSLGGLSAPLPAVNNIPSSGGFLTGSPEKTLQFGKFTGQQQDALSQILQQALSGLKNQGDFEPYAQKARSDFMQQTVPGLSERFTSMGSGSSLSSPAFMNTLGQSAAQFDQGLAGQRAQFGQNQQQMLMQLLGLGLQPQFETSYQPRSPGFLEQGAQGVLQSLPMLLSML